jgi:5-methylcytosine-specific restriction protein B
LDLAVRAEVDPSAPKSGKFPKVKELFAQLADLPLDSVVIFYCSKPENLTVRFGQPGSGGALGIAVAKTPDGLDLERWNKLAARYEAQARLAVGRGQVSSLVLCILNSEGRWVAYTIVDGGAKPFVGALRNSFPSARSVAPEVEAAMKDEIQEPPPTSAGELASQTYVEEQWFEDVLWMLEDRGGVIFYGPPGTGKTYLARKLAAYVQPNQNHRSLIQLHPSYSYEDFFEGYRPTVVDGAPTLTKRSGPLRMLARVAQDNPTQKCVLVIDEMNRGNLPRVFGELFFLLEYRDHEIPLMYSSDSGERFRLPRNVWFIGTMNTADRSIALLDQALRRRFHFAPLFPGEPPVDGMLRSYLASKRPDMVWVADVLDEANRRLADRNVAIGPSHLMRPDLDDEVLARVWRFSVVPTIEEHFFGRPDRLQEFELTVLRDAVQSQRSRGKRT